MNYSINSAFERIQWQLFKNKGVPNKTDIAAMKFLADWINQQQQETIRTHQLFAKFYVKALTDNFEIYRDFKFALKETESVCKLPLSYQCDLFRFTYNVMKYKMYCDEKGIPYVEEKYRTAEDRELIDDFIKNDQQFKKYLTGYWSQEKIDKSLTNEITHLIQTYKNGY